MNDWQLQSRSSNVWAQGRPATLSKSPDQFVAIQPKFISHAQGCHVFTHEGHYIDFIAGLGTNILGHNHPKVTEAVKEELKRGGPSFSLPTQHEVVFAEMICERFKMERVRFLKSGNEATLAAVRAARAYHGGKKPTIVSQGYHGHGDLWTSLTPPRYGVVDKFEIRQAKDIVLPTDAAAAIIEPVKLHIGDAELLKDWREVCKTADTLLIFDEVITGLRVPKGAVSKWADVMPDLTVFGKAFGNGFPISMVAGKKEILDRDYFVSTTFGGDSLSLVAAQAVLEELTDSILMDLWEMGKNFFKKLNERINTIGLNVEGYPTRGELRAFGGHYRDLGNVALFMQEMAKAGVLCGKAWFYTVAHMTQRVEDGVLNSVADVVEKIRRGEVRLEGTPPKWNSPIQEARE